MHLAFRPEDEDLLLAELFREPFVRREEGGGMEEEGGAFLDRGVID